MSTYPKSAARGTIRRATMTFAARSDASPKRSSKWFASTNVSSSEDERTVNTRSAKPARRASAIAWIAAETSSPLSCWPGVSSASRGTHTRGSSSRGPRRHRLDGCGNGRTAARGRPRRAPTSMAEGSPRHERLLPQLERPEELDLVLEHDAVLLARPPAGLCHQRDRVRGPGAVRVLDEVRVPRRDLGAPDPVALEAARLEHAAGAELVVGVLEDASERPPVRRLRRLSLGLQLGDPG